MVSRALGIVMTSFKAKRKISCFLNAIMVAPTIFMQRHQLKSSILREYMF